MLFLTQSPVQWSINMAEVVWFTFINRLLPFNILLLEGSSERGLFRDLFNHVFRWPYFQKYISYEIDLFLKCSSFTIEFKILETNWGKAFCFWDSCIWIGCLKLSLLDREYLSSAVNMLTNIPKTLYITKWYFFQVNCLQKDQ